MLEKNWWMIHVTVMRASREEYLCLLRLVGVNANLYSVRASNSSQYSREQFIKFNTPNLPTQGDIWGSLTNNYVLSQLCYINNLSWQATHCAITTSYCEEFSQIKKEKPVLFFEEKSSGFCRTYFIMAESEIDHTPAPSHASGLKKMGGAISCKFAKTANAFFFSSGWDAPSRVNTSSRGTWSGMLWSYISRVRSNSVLANANVWEAKVLF